MARGQKGTQDPEVTPEQLKDLARVLRLGITVKDACVFSGMSQETFYKWKNVGLTRPEGDPLREFADAVTKGRASAKIHALGQVTAGMKRDWKAAAWYLSVTNPKEFGPKVRETLLAEYSTAIERLKEALPPEMYAKALAALAGGDGESGASAPETGEVDPLRD